MSMQSKCCQGIAATCLHFVVFSQSKVVLPNLPLKNRRVYLQSATKSASPRTNPMYDVAIAKNENTSIIGCTI